MNLGPLQIAGIIPLILLSYVGGLYLFAYLGGWMALAKHYPAQRRPAGTAYHFRSCSVGGASYPVGLTLIVTQNGLYLSMILPFRFGHPPLFIPWTEFHSTRSKWFFFGRMTEAYVGMPVVAQMTLPRWVADYIQRGQESASEEGHSETDEA